MYRSKPDLRLISLFDHELNRSSLLQGGRGPPQNARALSDDLPRAAASVFCSTLSTRSPATLATLAGYWQANQKLETNTICKSFSRNNITCFQKQPFLFDAQNDSSRDGIGPTLKLHSSENSEDPVAILQTNHPRQR